VTKIVRILEREIVTGMRLLGASNVRELTLDMVNCPVVRIALTLIYLVGGAGRLATFETEVVVLEVGVTAVCRYVGTRPQIIRALMDLLSLR